MQECRMVAGAGDSSYAGNDMILKMAFVSERHYPDLQLACESDVVGRSYADYLMMINEYREESRALGVSFEIVHVNPQTFSLWCGDKKATWDELLHYAGSTCSVPRMVRDDSGKLFFPESPAVAGTGFVAAHSQ